MIVDNGISFGARQGVNGGVLGSFGDAQFSNTLDPDAAALCNASELFTPQQKNAVNFFIKQWKAAGLWDYTVSAHLFPGATINQIKYNAKDPRDSNAAHRLTQFGSGVINEDGFKGDGSTGYLTTYVAPNVKISNANQITLFVGNPIDISLGGVGSVTGTGRFYAGKGVFALATNETSTGESGTTNGIRAHIKTSASTGIVVKNNAVVINGSGYTSTGLSDAYIAIGALGSLGAPATTAAYHNNSVFDILIIYNGALTSQKAIEANQIILTYRAMLGKKPY